MRGDLKAPPFSAEDFRLRAAIDRGPHENFDYGDHSFNPGHPRVTGVRRLRDAAVLIPVVDHGAEASVILTKRAETLTDHSGQVAFPGGRIDPTDVSPEQAAQYRDVPIDDIVKRGDETLRIFVVDRGDERCVREVGNLVDNVIAGVF